MKEKTAPKHMIRWLAAGVLCVLLALSAIAAEDCIPFNTDNTRVNFINGTYKVVDRDMWMLDFGTNKAEAYQALEVIKHYRLNGQCFVGRSATGEPFEYWLSNGAAPTGSMPGEDCIPFNPKNLQVRYVSCGWVIVDGDVWLFNFGENRADAGVVLGIIQMYGFSSVCYVGRPYTSMTYLKGGW